MLRGTVKFDARIVDVEKGRTFALFEFDAPNQSAVDKVEIQASADELLSVVHLSGVATPDDGIVIAATVFTCALNRISFLHDLAIENGRVTDYDFWDIDNPHAPHRKPGSGASWMVGYAREFCRVFPVAI